LVLVKSSVDVFSCAAVYDRARLPLGGLAITARFRQAHSPVAFAMISFDTFDGTSAYESNTME
jgi:hypothetical protein